MVGSFNVLVKKVDEVAHGNLRHELTLRKELSLCWHMEEPPLAKSFVLLSDLHFWQVPPKDSASISEAYFARKA